MRIGQFLLRRLREAGIRHLFGVPGDYNLEFMQQLEEAGDPRWIGNCNELNAAYAVDDYARINGLAALVVTSAPETRRAVEGSDCLLAVGVRRVDSTSGFFFDHLPDTAIHLRPLSADVGDTNYQAVVLKEVLQHLVERTTPANISHPVAALLTLPRQDLPATTGKLTQASFWRAAQGFLRAGDVLIGEDGTFRARAGEFALPPRCTFITQAIWGASATAWAACLALSSPRRSGDTFCSSATVPSNSPRRNSRRCCDTGSALHLPDQQRRLYHRTHDPGRPRQLQQRDKLAVR